MVDELVEQHKPLAYILGNQPFHPLPVPLLVRPPTLIPRPETEHWLSHLTTLLHPTSSKPFTILDIGTGTGCIPLALVCGLRSPSPSNSEAPNVRAIAVDKADTAVSLARENVERCKESVGDRVKILQADLFAPDFVDRVRSTSTGGGGFDLVVSNPPYIPRKEYAELARSVKGWEDRGALVGELRGGVEELEADDDGLIFYRRISDILETLLVKERQTKDPVVAFEVGAGQASAVEELLRRKGLRAESFKDQWGVERMVVGYRV
ncbi:S-adenosyl-L-methionine-dependent methyltransferase [Leucosporidium creatinivorum]|uniref:S-adenosyl-L-methionine-dependent methyltransferase n=1 Tax=Leucosporidium creatinivorum TaxID=106004 RepID=A0A1Y2FZW1_9BASI|nr:S-adenosyl-L-methionine-dependent methyltransferase [Leucosporidium creatinivorum]